jgi:hypothetical protein
MSVVSSDNKTLARTIADAIGFHPKVVKYWDKDNVNSIDILSCEDPLDKELLFYSTLGLSDFPVYVNGNEFKYRIELLAGGKKSDTAVANILSTCAFYITKDKWECRPGAVFMRIVEMYNKQSPLKHIYFSTPFPWQDKINLIKLDTKSVACLLCVPISESELNYKLKNGDNALEKLLQEHDVDVFDYKRASVI